jgi:hypothetical protein
VKDERGKTVLKILCPKIRDSWRRDRTWKMRVLIKASPITKNMRVVGKCHK